MYISLIFLSSWVCVITELIIYDKKNQGITNLLDYPIPANTEKVKFQQNLLTHVPAGYYKNLPNLTIILLQHNSILDLDDFSFFQVPSVTEIELHQNQLSVIRKNMFAGLPNLHKLYLSVNKIHEIQPESFRENSALRTLLLSQNLLQHFPECMFHGENHPVNLNRFEINNNLISCDHFLCWLMKADHTWITVYSASLTVCAEPVELNGTTWDMLTAHDLNCDMPGGCYRISLKVLCFSILVAEHCPISRPLKATSIYWGLFAQKWVTFSRVNIYTRPSEALKNRYGFSY